MESSNDNIWESLRGEAEQAGKNERLLVAYLEETIQGQKSFDTALSYTLASKLRDEILPGITLRDLFWRFWNPKNRCGRASALIWRRLKIAIQRPTAT